MQAGGGLGMGLGGDPVAVVAPGMMSMLSATPELLARVAALGPVRDVPVIDFATETNRTGTSRCRTCFVSSAGRSSAAWCWWCSTP